MIKSPEGAQYKRNSTHVKLYHERERPEKSAPQEVVVGNVASDLREIQGLSRAVQVHNAMFVSLFYGSVWKRVIAWERSRVASAYGIIWGDAGLNKYGGS